MEILIKAHDELKQSFIKTMQKFMINGKRDDSKESTIYAMLELLLESAKKNADRKTNGQRYDDVIKELAYLLFHIGGLQLYEILSHNLPLPSVTTVRRLIYAQEIVSEGVFRIKQLKKFLVDRKYPLKVFLSEDATVVAQRVQYHPASNQVVGFPLPFDNNGLPVVGAFPATCANTMANYFSGNKPSKYAYCVVAQPMVPKGPTFVIAMFGTDNRFVAQQVHHRWQWILKEMSAEGIEVCGFASDGDSRLLKCMTFNMVTASPDSKWPWFKAKRSMPFVCVQDAIHIGNKLKSRLLSPSIILPFGNKLVASSGHLVELIERHQLKDQHLLCISDLNSKDKMNHAAMLRMSDKKVTDLLRLKVQGSEATAMYLDMMREVVEAFTSVSLSPLERIEMIWKWVFYLRIWRSKILDTPGYTLESNFVTRNALHCVELNAHALIVSIIKFRECEDHAAFLPWQMSSQPCESLFRVLRSKDPSFSILEMQNSLRRSDTLALSRLHLEGKIKFPRHHKAILKSNAVCHIPVSLPEDYEIEQVVHLALSQAVENAVKVGIMRKTSSATDIPLSSVAHLPVSAMELDEIDENEDINAEITPNDNDNEDEEEEEEEINIGSEEDIVDEVPDVIEDLLFVSTGSIGLKTFADVEITETCPFVVVTDGSNQPAIIKKSTLCWLLGSGNTKISADRLLRVQESSLSEKRPMCRLEVTIPSKESVISVSEWCAFNSEDNSVVIGRILAFRYMSGTTRKNQTYSKLDAPTSPPQKNARGLGCLCSWFKINKNLTLSPISMDIHGYYDVKHYICSIPRPRIVGKNFKLSCSLASIKNFLA